MEGGEHMLLWQKVLVMLGTIFYQWKRSKIYMANWKLYLFVWSMAKGWMNSSIKIGKLFSDYTLPTDEIGSDGSVEMNGITTTALQAKCVEQDDYLFDL